jgi:acetyl-CoA C-acetyltransferase
MREAVIVSTARTGIGKAYRGALNATRSPSLAGHVLDHAIRRTGVEPGEIEDFVLGTVLAAGTAGMNLGRNAVFAAGAPVELSAQTIDRQCASGLMAIATAAKQITADGMDIVAAGGHENISAVQDRYFAWTQETIDPAVTARVEHAYMPMLRTAEFVADKYGVTREQQDEYALSSQERTAAAQQAGRFDDEIVPFETDMLVKDRETGAIGEQRIVLDRDEGNRPSTTLETLAALKPVIDGGSITAGNASQLSDGASACVLMEASLAERRGLKPLGNYRGMAVAGCATEDQAPGATHPRQS